MSVVSVALSSNHEFSKTVVDTIKLVKDLGIERDCHNGPTVQHRSRLGIRPKPKNLRQVHLIPLEILEERQVKPAQIGENITTRGLDLLALGTGTRLTFVGEGSGKESPVIVLTGVRNPCPQIDKFKKGLQESFVVRDAQRKIIGRKAGVMATIEKGGVIQRGMKIVVEQPEHFQALAPV